MAYGDTCGKWKMCYPKEVEPETCQDCTSLVLGKRLVITLSGGQVQYVNAPSQPTFAINGTLTSGVTYFNPISFPGNVYWQLDGGATTSINNLTGTQWTQDQFLLSTLHEYTLPFSGSPFFSLCVALAKSYSYCYAYQNGFNLAWGHTLAIAISPSYQTSGSPPPFNQWQTQNQCQNYSSSVSQPSGSIEDFPPCDIDRVATNQSCSPIPSSPARFITQPTTTFNLVDAVP